MWVELDLLLNQYNPLAEWANCATPDCGNKVCTWANDTLCFPCLESIVGKQEMIKRYNETHDEPWNEVE